MDYQKNWIGSEELAEYIDDMKGERQDVKRLESDCKMLFAKEYHQNGPSWWVGRIVIALVSLVFILPAACMKRSFLESALEEKYTMMSFYLVAELAGMIAKILGAGALSTLGVSFWTVVTALVAVVGEIVSSAFSRGSEYGRGVDNPHIASLVL